MSLDLLEKAGKRQMQSPKGKKYWQYLGKYRCSFCGSETIKCRPNANNSCGCRHKDHSVYRKNKATGPTSHIKHNRGEASLHCRHYLDCMGKVPGGFKMNCPCDDFEYKKDCYKDEIQDIPYGDDSFSEHRCWTEMR